MRPVPPIAARQFGVFTTAQAAEIGWTASALRHATSTDELERIRPGAFATPLTAELTRWEAQRRAAQRAAAAVSLVNRGLPLSHGSSAVLTGMALVHPPEHVCATFARGRRGPMPGVHRHRGRLHRGEVMRIGRILLLSPARTVVDLGCELGVESAIAAADSALRQGLLTARDLRRSLANCAGWPGVRAAEQAIALADPRAESVLESLSRLRIHQAGLPAPVPQVRIYDANGVFCGRADFYWDEFGVVGECDGKAKYRDPDDALIDEKDRQGWLEDTGLIVVRWGWRDLDPFAVTRAKLRNALARGARPDRAERRWTATPSAWPQIQVVS